MVEEDEGKLDAKVEYLAADSMEFDLVKKKLYLFGDAQVKYDQIGLQAEYIELDLENDMLTAFGKPDSTGKEVGRPKFNDGQQEFTSDTMRYNFTTQKGKISEAVVQEGEGYIHGKQVKKMSDDIIYIQHGKYTTCNADDPHFHIEATKPKVIQNNKIITGPAYLKVADIPTPLAVPFGLFPNQQKRNSGIVLPAYGESPELGFYLTQGGYYLGISDYVDLAILGDIYSRGSWGVTGISNYAKRYKFKGNMNLSYSRFLRGFQESPSFTRTNNFFVRWTHSQDSKARPNSRFSANVNAGSSNNFRNNFNSNTSDFLTNTFQSRVNYNTSFFNRKLNLTLNGSHAQNTSDSTISITLPEMTLASKRFFLGDVLGKPGGRKWYSKLGVSYTGNGRNTVKTKEATLFEQSTLEQMRNGFRHNIPVSTSVKMFKWFTLNPSANYTEKWHFQRETRTWNAEDTLVARDTMQGFWATREYGVSASLSTKLYGYYEPRIGAIKKLIPVIRHVATPSVNFSLKPDFAQPRFNYYDSVRVDTAGTMQAYSPYSYGVYGAPSSGESGLVTFSLINNLEMKVRDRQDTTGKGTRKIKIFESFNFSSSYNIFRDSLNWSNLNMNARTTIFKNVNLLATGSMDPYALDPDGNNINESEWSRHRRIGRFTNGTATVSFSLRSKNNKNTNSNANNQQSTSATDRTQDRINANQNDALAPEERERIANNPEAYVDFNIPWTLRVNYNLTYSQPNYRESRNVTNTIGLSGDVNLTPKWKVGFRTGYDFVQKDLTITNIDIYRDLHCWEMTFNVVPFGSRRSYVFNIRVKSSILQDLKLSRRRSWYDF